MSLYPKFRDVHLYVGLALMIPLGIIAATGIGLNHEESLGLKQKGHVEKKGPKGKGEKAKPEDHGSPSSESQLAAPDSSKKSRGKPADDQFRSVPATTGPYSQGVDQALPAARHIWGRQVSLERIEVKYEKGLGMVAKVKAARSEKIEPDEVVWSITEGARVIRPEDRPHEAGVMGTNWAKVIKDLHTGKFFSKDNGYWWSDISAGAMLLLSLTGVVLYVIPLVKKRASRKNRLGAVKSQPAVPRRPAPQKSPAVALATAIVPEPLGAE